MRAPRTRGGSIPCLRAGALGATTRALPRNSAAVLAARALVRNSIDDGAGAFEHDKQGSGVR